MTATLLLSRDQDRPQVAVAPLDAPRSSGDDLPDPTRDFFAGCVTTYTLPAYVAMVGPLTATPQRSLADVVQDIAS